MTDTFEHQDWNTVTFVKYKQPTQKEKSETQRRVEVATKMSKLDNPDYVPPKPEKVLGKALPGNYISLINRHLAINLRQLGKK